MNQLGTSEAGNYRVYAVDHQLPIEHVNVAGGYALSEDREVLLLDEERQPVVPGAVGEIGVRSAYMSVGYWHDHARTQAQICAHRRR